MEYEIYNPNEANDTNENSIGGKFASNKELDMIRSSDVGYNKMYRQVPRASDDKLIKKKIDFYTSGIVGSNIRDAETGEYYSEFVGSKYEDLYFKVSLSTGECKSLNGSHTLFYLSPQHYERHLYVDMNEDIINNWEEKKNALVVKMKNNKTRSTNKNTNKNYGYVTVK